MTHPTPTEQRAAVAKVRQMLDEQMGEAKNGPDLALLDALKAAEETIGRSEGIMGVIDKIAATPDIDRPLQVFIDHWGMDAYEPPYLVTGAVRGIVAHALAEGIAARPAPE